MATIRSFDDDLFRSGLVDMTADLYRIVVDEAKKATNGFARRIDRKLLSDAVESICSRRGHNGITLIGTGNNLRLSLFVESIELVLGRASVEIRLSLPILAETRDNTLMWEKILRSIPIPAGSSIKDGELSIKMILPSRHSVVEKSVSNGKRSFSLSGN